MDNTPSWLKQVQAKEREIPSWLLQVLNHPRFVTLRKGLDGRWWIITDQELDFEEDDVETVCNRFANHFGIG